MRLIVARCEVTYSGRLNAFLPESTRLLMLKDGSVLVPTPAGTSRSIEDFYRRLEAPALASSLQSDRRSR